MNLQDKIVLVLGMGETGLSMVKWLSRQGAQVRVADSRTNPPNWEALSAEIFPNCRLIKANLNPACWMALK
jgi:UDP-N-acetylmuramoylalanine--D-glutamate ligase